MIKKKRAVGIQALIICISSTLVLLVLGTVLFLLTGGHRLSDYVKEKFSLSLVIDEKSTPQQLAALRKLVDEMPCVAHSNYVSGEQVLEEQRRLLGSDPAEFLGFNPYNSTLNINLLPQYTAADSLTIIKERLAQAPGVSEVLYQHQLIEEVNRNLAKVNGLLLLFAAAMLLISCSLINSMVKLTIFSQRFLLHTMKLVGAEWSFIRRPFMARGFWMGLASGLAAIALLAAAYLLALHHEPDLQRLITPLHFAQVAAAVLGLGLAVVMISVYFSINRFLKLRANELFYL